MYLSYGVVLASPVFNLEQFHLHYCIYVTLESLTEALKREHG